MHLKYFYLSIYKCIYQCLNKKFRNIFIKISTINTHINTFIHSSIPMLHKSVHSSIRLIWLIDCRLMNCCNGRRWCSRVFGRRKQTGCSNTIVRGNHLSFSRQNYFLPRKFSVLHQKYRICLRNFLSALQNALFCDINAIVDQSAPKLLICSLVVKHDVNTVLIFCVYF